MQWAPCSHCYCRQIARFSGHCVFLRHRERLVLVKFFNIPKQKFESQLTAHLFSDKARIFTQCFKFFKSRRGLLERAFYPVFFKNNIKQYTEMFQF